MSNIYLTDKELEKYKSGELTMEFYRYDENENCLVPKTEEEIFSEPGTDEYYHYIAMKTDEMEMYLSDTDWYIVRKAETGKDVPESILNTRNVYREKISQYRNLTI